MQPARLLPAFLALSMWAVAPPAQGHGGDDGGGVLEAEARLLPPDGSPQPGAKGEVEVSMSLRGQEFEVEVERADPSVALEAFLDDGSGAFVSIGVLTPECEDDHIVLELEFDTSDGDALPLGVATVGLLADAAIEIRDGEGRVVLSGTVPVFVAACGSVSRTARSRR